MIWKTQLKETELKKSLLESFKPINYPGYWMILWVGEFFSKSDGNVLVDYYLVKIKDQELSKLDSTSFDFSKVQSASIHASLVPILRPGTIILNGEIQMDQHYDYWEPTKLRIDNTGSTSKKLKEWKYGVAFKTAIGLVRNQYPSTNVRINAIDEMPVWILKNIDPSINADYILYPSAEVMRFYFFKSSRLVQALTNPFSISNKKPVLFDIKSLKFPSPDEPWHTIIIRNNMLLNDVHIIARIAFDQKAKSAANQIYLSFLHRSTFRPGQAHLDTSFPFSGSASQEVNGFVVEVDNIKVFFVLEILACYSKFPFNSLRYDRETSNNYVNNKLDPTPGKSYDPNNKGDKSDPNTKPVFIYDPKFDPDPNNNSEIKNDRKFNKAQLADHRNSFPNLTKDIHRLSTGKEVAPKMDYEKVINLPASNISTNENKGDKTDSAGYEIISKELTPINFHSGNYADLFKLIVQHFIKMGCRITFHNLIDPLGQTEFCYVTIDVISLDNLSSSQKAFSEMGNGVKRRCIILDVEYKNKHFLLFEMEPHGQNSYKAFVKSKGDDSTSELYSYFSMNDVKSIINDIVRATGGFKNHPVITCYNIYHEKTSPEAHAIRILNRIKFL